MNNAIYGLHLIQTKYRIMKKVLLFFISVAFVFGCTESNVVLPDEDGSVLELRDKVLVGPPSNPYDHYPECPDGRIDVLNGAYNQLGNYICCNYVGNSERSFLEFLYAGSSTNISWYVSGLEIRDELTSGIITNFPCPGSSGSIYIYVTVYDHDLKCKVTLSTQIYNNSGPCRLGEHLDNDCLDRGLSAFECMCEKRPYLPECQFGEQH